MPRNRVQFQKGRSLAGFLDRYGAESACREALIRWRWPAGFLCPGCGYGGHCRLQTRAVLQCHRCHRQTSATAGTIFAGSKLPLRSWFLALYLLTQAKNGLSALSLARQLGMAYNSAWLLKHKLMQVLLEQDRQQPLAGVIQLDDAYWGGRRRGQRRGRGTAGKVPLLAAVATDPARQRPQTLRLTPLHSFRQREVNRWADRHLAHDACIHSDAFAAFATLRIPRSSAADSSACRAGVPRHAGPRVTGRCYSRSIDDVRQRALAVLAAAADFCLRIDSPLSVSR